MKKIIVLLITILSIYVIYSLFNINKVNYVSINDTVLNKYNYYIKEYLVNNNKLDNYVDSFNSSSIIKAYQDIKNNRTIRIDKTDYYLKKVLRESDVLVLSVGMEELASKFDKYNMDINYCYFNELYNNIERLINLVKKYAYSKIIFIGYYNPTNYYDSNIDQLFYDINLKLNRLMKNNEITYIELYELIKGNDYKKKNTIYLNEEGNKELANIIKLYI